MTEALADERETLSTRVARRLRGAIAENRIVQRDLAAAAGIGQPQMSRRITGFTPFTLDEIERVAEVLDVDIEELLGTGPFEGRPIGRCAIRDSNPEPADSTPRVALSIVGRLPLGSPPLPARPKPETPRRHLVLIGGAA